MNKSILNALRSVAVLTLIAVVCVGLLAVCNMFFPKYVPTLDRATAAQINKLCDTGKSDDEAFDGGYIVMLQESDFDCDIAAFNKSHKSSKATVLAVYGEPKGLHAGAYVVETSATGRDGDVITLTAYVDGAIVGAMVKKQGESYFYKLLDLPYDIFDKVIDKVGDDVGLVNEIGKTGATITLTAIERTLNLSGAFACDYNTAIRAALAKITTEAGND